MLFYNWLFVFKIKGIFGKKSPTKSVLKWVVFFLYSIDKKNKIKEKKRETKMIILFSCCIQYVTCDLCL